MGPNLVFFTLTLRPKVYHYQAITQYELSYHRVKEHITRYTSKCDYVVELTKDCNIHFHGVCLFRDTLQRLCFVDVTRKSRLMGYVKINPPIEDNASLHRVVNYLLKDIKDTMKLLHNSRYKPSLITSV